MLIFWPFVPEGLRYRNLSSQIVGKFSQNTQDISQDFELPFAYETAMEALSTLITQKKRNGTSAVNGQNQKLDRMLRYIKVVPFLAGIVSPLILACIFLVPVLPFYLCLTTVSKYAVN